MKPARDFRTATIITITITALVALNFELRAQMANISPKEAGFQLIPPALVPQTGTFWSRQRGAPYPFNPFTRNYTNISVDVYALPNGSFVFDDAAVDYEALYKQQKADARSQSMMLDSDDPDPPPPESLLRNYEKFLAQSFSVIDTNVAAEVDTNLYNALLSFPDDTNTFPTLQIMAYGTNSVIIRANHFDYSAETDRDFALVICDKIETPLWKEIDFFGASDSQDGWLIQGSVLRTKVTDPMYLMVSNINPAYNGFFRAIPYRGPEIQLTGAQPFDVVSNTIALPATVADLSGVSNVQFSVAVDGVPARYSFGTNNTVMLETKYNPNGLANIYVNAYSRARIYDPTNAPDNEQLGFSGTATVSLDFENPTYLAFAGNYASPDVGTNYILFVIDKAQQIEARIFNPANNQTLASYSNYFPSATTIAIPWNFTLADGVTSYTNDEYALHFVAYDPEQLDITNKIDRVGVRTGAGCYLTYQEEDPFAPIYGMSNAYLNDQANTWFKGTLKGLYTDLYKPQSLTQYSTSQVGTNRNHSACTAQDPGNVEWALFLRPALSNSIYSDFTLGQAHGNGFYIGAGGYFLNKFSSWDLLGWVQGYGSNWRLRKAAIWSCWSGADNSETGDLSFAAACGIRPMGLQVRSYMRKNCGLFFGGKIDQAWVTDHETITTTHAAEFLDQAWVCGKNQYPGGCDPTYAFEWAVRALLGKYPEMNPNGQAQPRLYGYPSMIYSSVYDDELMRLDETHVKHN